MSGFSADWLARREAADARARNRALVAALPRSLPAVVDLGAGTGANLRWLAPQLGPAQHWRLLDKDTALLARAATATHAWARARGYAAESRDGGLAVTGPGFDCRITLKARDLATGLDRLDLPAGCLVTASALLDLVSRDWLEALIGLIAANRGAVLFALSFDGRIEIDPPASEDETVASLVNRHQLTDKGFGAALGPAAWQFAQAGLEQAGFVVRSAATPWSLGPADAGLLAPLIAGWAEAAAAMAPDEHSAIEAWRDRRLAAAAAGRLEVTVGHRDLAAWLPAAD